MDQGEIIWLQSWGQTSLDLSRARPNSPDELFYQGSITKSLTALALIHLQNQGLISIDDPLSRHIPQTQGHPVGKVSIRQIMSHSSGLGVCRI
jgi:CubicO group peptidase (beta-lactamase class C family)